MHNSTCVHCDRPIHFGSKVGVWVHDQPLGQMRVSRAEADAIKADPPHEKEPLHREPVLHQATPDRSI